jgi:threonine dehydratase
MASPVRSAVPALEDVRAAAERIRHGILRTPLRPSPWLSRAASATVLLKLETLQPTFSYKIRGALNAVRRAAESGRAARLVTASAGNHGRAMAAAAAAAGFPLTVYAPATAPRTKLDAIRASGADLQLCASYDEAERRAKDAARREGALFVSPYSHADVIAGAATIALEILEDRPDVERIVVPIGGGGLISGIAIGADGRAAVWGVEVEASSPFTRSLAAGRIVEIDVQPTLADGLAGNLDPDTVTFDLVRRLVGGVVLVSETDLRRALVGLVQEERLVVEGAGAAATAALLCGALSVSSETVAVVVSGGNIDSERLGEILGVSSVSGSES